MKWGMVRPRSKTCNNEFAYIFQEYQVLISIIKKAETPSAHSNFALTKKYYSKL